MLRVEYSGTRLIPDTIHQLDARKAAWRSTTGSPARYVQLGFDLFGITPQPTSGNLTLTYAAEPATMSLATDTPEIAPEHQPTLVDGAYAICRLKEGGQELQLGLQYMKRFVGEAAKYQGFVRSRSRGQIYDNVPVDLSRFDAGRFDVKLKQQKMMPKQ